MSMRDERADRGGILDAIGRVGGARRGERGVRRATRAFAVAMLGLFLVALLGSVVLGTTVYRHVFETSRSIEDARQSLGVIANAIRANDATGSVTVAEGPEGPALVLVERLGDDSYETRFYLSDGWIVEEYAAAGSPLSPDSATPVAESATFDVGLGERAVTVTCDADTTTLALRSDGAVFDQAGEVAA